MTETRAALGNLKSPSRAVSIDYGKVHVQSCAVHAAAGSVTSQKPVSKCQAPSLSWISTEYERIAFPLAAGGCHEIVTLNPVNAVVATAGAEGFLAAITMTCGEGASDNPWIFFTQYLKVYD